MSTNEMSSRTTQDASWFRKLHEQARTRNALVPPHGRMVITGPLMLVYRADVTTPTEGATS